jgi:DEAD/DEAH box helicase domain-containing protein
VHHLDEDNSKAIVRPVQVEYITIPKDHAKYDIQTIDEAFLDPYLIVPIHRGTIRYTKVVDGYHKVNPKTNYIFETVESTLSSSSKQVYGFWIDIPPPPLLDIHQITRGIHAIQHCLLILAPIYCTTTSLLTQCISQSTLHRILIYEPRNRPSPIKLMQQYVPTMLKRAKRLLEECKCEDGCVSCCHMPTCASRNKSISKNDGMLVLKALLNHDVD